MNPVEAEAYLREHIPVSSALGVRVMACDLAGVTLASPLAPNVNHRGTVFGGSTSAVAILAAWSWLHFALVASGRVTRVVLQRNSVEYSAPITADFEARCAALPAAAWEKFLRMLDRHGRARITLAVDVNSGGAKVATLSGDYVAIATETPDGK